MERKIILVDENTGEKIGNYTPKRRPSYHYHLTFYSALGKAGINLTATMQVILGQMDTHNKIILNKDKIRTLSNNYGFTANAIKVAAHKMVVQGLIQMLGSAIYFANPYYFSKANLQGLEELRQDYSQSLFETRRKTTGKAAISLDKQIDDIKKAKTDPVSRAKDILNNSKPFV